MAEDDIGRLHGEAPFTDVHIHPSLKAYLFNRNLWRHYFSGATWNPFASRSDFKMLAKGRVGVIWAAHHVPERELFEQCTVAGLAARALVPNFARKISGDPFDRLLEQMDAMQSEIERQSDKVELALSASAVKRIRAAGKIAVVNCVEGAHVFKPSPEHMEHNLGVLAGRGVAMITLCHFYPNGVASHTDGVPQDMFIRKICKLDFGADEPPPLTEFGRMLIRKMNELSMIVDVSHCSPEAREEIYAEIGTDRPVVASHVGVRRYMNDRYNPTDDEIRHVARTGGAIGVIFMTYWLDDRHPNDGLDAVWRTMEHIHHVTGSWDHVVIGTDFDGFTDPPDDLRDASQVGKVTGMLLEKGVSEPDIKKVLGGNAQRVLELGWRR